MGTPVKPWLEHAILQSVAESYLDRWNNWGTSLSPGSQAKAGLPLYPLDIVLKQGVNHPQYNPDADGATRLTPQQIAWFKDNYVIVTHYANDASGFSATLFRNKTTGEYTLSFRSTEYYEQNKGGDWERDGADAADGEISKYGFALAQLASMERFYAELKAGRTFNNATGLFEASAGAQAFANSPHVLDVTGYSLGGHLASAFTLMHGSDIRQTYNYNAAGLGGIRIGGGSFQAPSASSIEMLIDLYHEMMGWGGNGTPVWASHWSEDDLEALRAAAVANPGGATGANVYLTEKHQAAMALIGSLTVGAGLGDADDGVLGGLGTQRLLDSAGRWLQSTGHGPLGHDPNAFASPLFGTGWGTILQIYGHGEFWDPEMVANGGYDVANPQAIWIEDLPASRGLGILELFAPTEARGYLEMAAGADDHLPALRARGRLRPKRRVPSRGPTASSPMANS